MHLPFCSGGKGGGEGGVEPPIKFSKRGGLTGSQLLLEGACWESGGWLFPGGCNFYTKNKLKSKIFNDKKKFINKNILSVIAKNSNWENFN